MPRIDRYMAGGGWWFRTNGELLLGRKFEIVKMNLENETKKAEGTADEMMTYGSER